MDTSKVQLAAARTHGVAGDDSDGQAQGREAAFRPAAGAGTDDAHIRLLSRGVLNLKEGGLEFETAKPPFKLRSGGS